MADTDTVTHLFTLATAAENAAEAMYLILAQRFAPYSEVARFWHEMAHEETVHARTLERLKSQIRPLAYGKWARVDTGIGTGLEIRLQRAGHILGSAYVECRITTPNARHRVIFSGDLGAAHTPLLPEPEPPLGCHALVIESTYGDRRHEGRADRVRRLQRVIERDGSPERR